MQYTSQRYNKRTVSNHAAKIRDDLYRKKSITPTAILFTDFFYKQYL